MKQNKTSKQNDGSTKNSSTTVEQDPVTKTPKAPKAAKVEKVEKLNFPPLPAEPAPAPVPAQVVETEKAPKAAKTPKAPKPAKVDDDAEIGDRLTGTLDELKAAKGGLVTYLFLSGKDKEAIAQELKAKFSLEDAQAAKIVRRITGRVRLFQRAQELMKAA